MAACDWCGVTFSRHHRTCKAGAAVARELGNLLRRMREADLREKVMPPVTSMSDWNISTLGADGHQIRITLTDFCEADEWVRRLHSILPAEVAGVVEGADHG